MRYEIGQKVFLADIKSNFFGVMDLSLTPCLIVNRYESNVFLNYDVRYIENDKIMTATVPESQIFDNEKEAINELKKQLENM